MKAQHIVLEGDRVSVEEVRVEEVTCSTPRPKVVRLPVRRTPRVPMTEFLPSYLDERAHDLL